MKKNQSDYFCSAKKRQQSLDKALHDLASPLTAINLSLYQLNMKIDDTNQPAIQLIEDANQALTKINEQMSQLSEYLNKS